MSSPLRKFLARASLAVLALLAFLATSAGIRSILVPDHRDEISEKMAYLAEHAPGATALFFGSSAVLHGVRPDIVDPIVQEFEPSFRSINAGVSGSRDFEQDKFIRDVLALPGVDPTWVFVQPPNFLGWVMERYLDTDRTLRWHDLRQSLAAALISFEGKQPQLEAQGRAYWAWYHVRKFFHRLGNYGQIGRLVESLQSPERRRNLPVSLLEAGRGYVSVEELTGRVGQVNSERLLDNLDKYKLDVANLASRKGQTLTGVPLRYFRRQRDWLADQGLKVIYLMPPYQDGGLYAGALHEAGEAPYLVDLVKPMEYRVLYQLEHRFDPYHMNMEGAEILSRLVGKLTVVELERMRAAESGGGE